MLLQYVCIEKSRANLILFRYSAASCGLFVVSTKVGGVPEVLLLPYASISVRKFHTHIHLNSLFYNVQVLPPSMINFAEPNVESLSEALIEAVSICR